MAKKVVVQLPSRKTKKKKPAVKAQELTRLGAALRGLGSLGGSALGGLIGQSGAGGSLGQSLGASLSKWLGSGDYTVSSNSLTRLDASGNIPMMHKDNQTIVVRHKEFLGEIRGKQSFTVVRSLPVNPGMPETFPWLSTIAGKFQEYRIRGLVYHYVPTSGTAISSSNAALGSVMIQTNYRAGDSEPASKQELLNEYWATESVPCAAFCHPIECDPKENPYNLHYVRGGGLPSGADRLLYDMGTTYVAVSGMQADDQVVGDLWITYEIELKKPVVVSDLAQTSQAFAAQISDDSGSITGTTIFDGTQLISPYGNIQDITLSANTLTIPAYHVGRFFIFINIEASTTFSAFTVSASPTLSGCTLELMAPSPAGALRNVLGGTTPTLNRGFYTLTVRKVDAHTAATITIPNITLTGAATFTNIMVFKRDGVLWAA